MCIWIWDRFETLFGESVLPHNYKIITLWSVIFVEESWFWTNCTTTTIIKPVWNFSDKTWPILCNAMGFEIVIGYLHCPNLAQMYYGLSDLEKANPIKLT